MRSLNSAVEKKTTCRLDKCNFVSEHANYKQNQFQCWIVVAFDLVHLNLFAIACRYVRFELGLGVRDHSWNLMGFFGVRARESFAFQLIPIELLQIFPTNLNLNKFQRLIWITKIGLNWWKKPTPQRLFAYLVICHVCHAKKWSPNKMQILHLNYLRVFCKYNKHHLRFAPKWNLKIDLFLTLEIQVSGKSLFIRWNIHICVLCQRQTKLWISFCLPSQIAVCNRIIWFNSKPLKRFRKKFCEYIKKTALSFDNKIVTHENFTIEQIKCVGRKVHC